MLLMLRPRKLPVPAGFADQLVRTLPLTSGYRPGARHWSHAVIRRHSAFTSRRAPSWSRLEPLDEPAVGLARGADAAIPQAIVQPVPPALPELDAARAQPVATP